MAKAAQTVRSVYFCPLDLGRGDGAKCEAEVHVATADASELIQAVCDEGHVLNTAEFRLEMLHWLHEFCIKAEGPKETDNEPV